MKPILSSLINLKQGAFVGGCSISNNVSIIQEFMYGLQKVLAHHYLMAIKLDMEKAYDRIYMDFLHHALVSLEFHSCWIGYIMGCIHTPSFFILINGTFTDFFHSIMGLC